MQLLIIRHAESYNNLVDLQGGGTTAKVPDPSLTPNGELQASRLARLMRQPDRYPPVAAIYASPTQRSAATALVVAAELGLPVRLDHNLHEHLPADGVADPCDQTALDALCRANPRVVPPQLAFGSGCPIRDRESEQDATVRAQLFLQNLHASNDCDGFIAVVTHVNFTQALLRVIIGGAWNPVWFRLANTGSIALTIGRDETVVHWFNRSDHLPGLPDLRGSLRAPVNAHT